MGGGYPDLSGSTTILNFFLMCAMHRLKTLRVFNLWCHAILERLVVFTPLNSRSNCLTAVTIQDNSTNRLSYLRYDPCRPTSTCSWRRPYKIPVRTLDSTVHCVSYLTGINSLWCTSQGISNWSLVLQYTIEAEYTLLLL